MGRRGSPLPATQPATCGSGPWRTQWRRCWRSRRRPPRSGESRCMQAPCRDTAPPSLPCAPRARREPTWLGCTALAASQRTRWRPSPPSPSRSAITWPRMAAVRARRPPPWPARPAAALAPPPRPRPSGPSCRLRYPRPTGSCGSGTSTTSKLSPSRGQGRAACRPVQRCQASSRSRRAGSCTCTTRGRPLPYPRQSPLWTPCWSPSRRDSARQSRPCARTTQTARVLSMLLLPSSQRSRSRCCPRWRRP
mmetsp:Transcript_4667/g.18686  ORF Transcript_4667/g.18686 Transcript_4667/m.18686 type:complete len:250 (+) Transcript_4667:888-1637(+)